MKKLKKYKVKYYYTVEVEAKNKEEAYDKADTIVNKKIGSCYEELSDEIEEITK